jgi:Tfp pilus assembly protein PilO
MSWTICLLVAIGVGIIDYQFELADRLDKIAEEQTRIVDELEAWREL